MHIISSTLLRRQEKIRSRAPIHDGLRFPFCGIEVAEFNWYHTALASFAVGNARTMMCSIRVSRKIKSVIIICLSVDLSIFRRFFHQRYLSTDLPKKSTSMVSQISIMRASYLRFCAFFFFGAKDSQIRKND